MIDRHVIEAKSLVKSYGTYTAVNSMSFEVHPGEAFALLGPNGAGKSSLMRMMYCLSQATQGELFILGLNVRNHAKEIKSRIGVVPQDDGLDADFSVLDNLLLYARYFQIPEAVAKPRAHELLRMLRLHEYEESKVDTLSGGLRRRLTLARALLNQPELLFLDEPTTGLDPQARLFIWDYLGRMKKEGKTIVMTTHYMEEAEILCDRVAILDKGKILGIDSPAALIRAHAGQQVIEFGVKSEDINYYTKRLQLAAIDYQVIENRILTFLRDPMTSQDVMKIISSDNILIRKPCLNDVFLKLSGHQLRD